MDSTRRIHKPCAVFRVISLNALWFCLFDCFKNDKRVLLTLFKIILQIFTVFMASKTVFVEGQRCIPEGAHGAQRQLWNNVNSLDNLKTDPRYPDNPSKSDYITTFEAPRRLTDLYGQTLTAYFLAPETGNHVFYMACDDQCQLLVSGDPNPEHARVEIDVPSYTSYRQWEGSRNKPSTPIYMVEGHLYYIHAIMAQQKGGEHLSVGVRLPSGSYKRPLISNHVLKYPLKDINNMTSLRAWAEWSSCTKTCGDGMQTRSRLCLNSSFQFSIKKATFTQSERRVCHFEIPCPTPPQKIVAQVESHTSIKITWLPLDFKPSVLRGYKLTYRTMTLPQRRKRIRRNAPAPNTTFSYEISGSDEGADIIIPASYQSVILSGLDAITKYCIQMAVLTKYWESQPSACVNVTTAEHIPSLPPTNVTALNLTGPDKILVKWSAVPKKSQNGLLQGYIISIHRLATANIQLQDNENWTITVNASSMQTMLTGLESYTSYQIRVAAFTSKGTGPYCSPVYAETCRCPKILHTSWWNLSPSSGRNPTRGTFPTLIRNVIDSKCGLCHKQKGTIVDFYGLESNDNVTRSSLKPTLNEVMKSVTSADISFPLCVEKRKNLTRSDFRFVTVLELSAGAVYINRKLSPDVYAKMVGSSVFQCWPILLLISLMSLLAGIILCILESISYPLRTCYRSSFLKGVYEYTWCAFVSMTTVGYGDRFPRSVQGRIFTIIWFIVGWILTCLFVATLASSLCVKIVVITKNPVQGGKVGVVRRTPEHKIAMSINGTKGTHCVEYPNIDDMLKDLKDGVINGILIDALSSNNLNETILPPSLFQVAKTFDLELNYGIGLSRGAIKLEQLFIEYVKENPVSLDIPKENLKKKNHSAVAALVNTEPQAPINSPKKMKKKNTEEKQINFFDPSNTMYKKTMYFTSGFLLGAVICGLFFYHLTSREQLSRKPKQDLVLKFKNLSTRELIAEQRDMLRSFYHRYLMVTYHLRHKHRKEQQLLLRKLRKQNKHKYCSVPLFERYTSKQEFTEDRTQRPDIRHHREFTENNNAETML